MLPRLESVLLPRVGFVRCHPSDGGLRIREDRARYGVLFLREADSKSCATHSAWSASLLYPI